MLLYRSTSIVQLIRRGLLVMALLLVFGQLVAVISVDRLTRQSGRAVYDAAEAMHNSQQLATEIALMERSARQFDVVRDDNIYRVYLEHRQQFLQFAQALLAKPLDDLQRSQLQSLIEQENEIFRRLTETRPGSPEAQEAIDGFWVLNTMGRTILTESQEYIRGEVKRIQSAAADAKRQLMVQAAVFIAAALILAVLYSRWINRPIGQLEQAIAQLGRGNLTEAIQVSAGPRDFHELGHELEGLRQRLLALEQQKVLMLRNFSHELKTPLATIREGLELLKDQVPGQLNREQSDIIDIVRGNSIKLQKLIEDLINLNVAQGEQISVTWQPVGLQGVLDEVLEEQRLLAEGRGLLVQRTFEVATVPGDREKLKTVFQNVVSNAIKYSPDGGAINVTLRRDTDHAIVDVMDEGPGIDPSERQKVFELFYRGRRRPGGQIKGSGVGLTIAQTYVRLHNGKIEIVDAARGAHLRVALPLVGGLT